MSITAAWLKKFTITVNSADVLETETGYPLWIPESVLPAGFFDNCNADLSDFRITTDVDGATEIPVDIRFGSTSTSKCDTETKMNPSSSSNVVLYGWIGNSAATMPAHTDTYGAHNTYRSEIIDWWTLNQTGDGTVGEFLSQTDKHDAGQGGGGLSDQVPSAETYFMYKTQGMDGAGDYIKIPHSSNIAIAGAFTIIQHLRFDVFTKYHQSYYKGQYAGDSYGIFLQFNQTSKTLTIATKTGYTYTTTSAFAIDTDYLVVVTHDGTTGTANMKVYVNGALFHTFNNAAIPVDDGNNLILGGLGGVTNYNSLDGKIGDTILINTNLSANWQETFYNNVTNPTSFITCGALQDTGSAEKAAVGYLGT